MNNIDRLDKEEVSWMVTRIFPLLQMAMAWWVDLSENLCKVENVVWNCMEQALQNLSKMSSNEWLILVAAQSMKCVWISIVVLVLCFKINKMLQIRMSIMQSVVECSQLQLIGMTARARWNLEANQKDLKVSSPSSKILFTKSRFKMLVQLNQWFKDKQKWKDSVQI